MRELDESAVRSWARTALFDPFVTHMVVGQHWNSTPFPSVRFTMRAMYAQIRSTCLR